MMGNIQNRIKSIEKICRPDPLKVLCETESGTEILTVSECVRRGLDFKRVVSGADLHDLDRLLRYMQDAAKEG